MLCRLRIFRTEKFIKVDAVFYFGDVKMRIESNCFAEEEKIYCLEFSEKEFELKVRTVDYIDEEEQSYILEKDSFRELFEFLKNNMKAFVDADCSYEDEEVWHNYEEENFVYTISYNLMFEPVRISFFISDVGLFLHFYV